MPPACLHPWWCHAIVGDPTSQTQAVYRPVAVFTIQASDYTYVAYDGGAAVGYVINAPITFGISDSGTILYLTNGVDLSAAAH